MICILFVLYLTALSVTQAVVFNDIIVNNELEKICTEAVMAYLDIHLSSNVSRRSTLTAGSRFLFL